MDPDKTEESKSNTRTVPVNTNYFSGQPVIEQRLQDVEKFYEQYKYLPKAPSHVWAQRQWTHAQVANNEELDMTVGIFDQKSLKGRTKRIMIALGKELNKIHPVLMPPELKKWLDQFAPLKYNGSAGARQTRMLDKFQRSRGNGKRKTARAKVQIVPGEGSVFVNGKLAADFFKRTKDVENVIWPLQSLSVLGQYNVWVSTWGGGTTGMFYDMLS
jgi:small subunit ribosomal protein S9